MKIGFIGSGNMASAIVNGAVHSKRFSPEDIYVFDINTEKTNELSKRLGVKIAINEKDLVNNCDVVVLAVKPNIFPSLVPEISESVKNKNPLVVSIAAGKTIDFITGLFGFDVSLVRVMPNLNAEVFEAISAYCTNKNVSNEQIGVVEVLLSSFGNVVSVDEKYFSIFGVIGGCAPAYSFMFIDALAKGAVKNGLPEELALKVAAQTVLGSAKMLLEGGQEPWHLIDRVCSPGGTTIEGVNSLKEDDLTAVVMKAMQASYEKDKRM